MEELNVVMINSCTRRLGGVDKGAVCPRLLTLSHSTSKYPLLYGTFSRVGVAVAFIVTHSIALFSTALTLSLLSTPKFKPGLEIILLRGKNVLQDHFFYNMHLYCKIIN